MRNTMLAAQAWCLPLTFIEPRGNRMDKTDLNKRRMALGLSVRSLSETARISYGSCWNWTVGGRADRAITGNLKKLTDCMDRLEKERREKQEENHVKG